MPILSIIVPHRHDDTRLEATLLSILENRPQDCELIVVHDGSYTDPYQLADELTYVRAPRGSSTMSMFNAACDVARSPNVCTLLDGVTVSPGWSDEPLDALESDGVDAVAVHLRVAGMSNYGISSAALRRPSELRRGRVHLTQPADRCAGPSLACGFFALDSLRALGGWNEQLAPQVAAVELAYLLVEAAWDVQCASGTTVTMATPIAWTSTAKRQLAELAAAHDVVAAGTASAVSEFVNCLLAGQWGQAAAWSMGIRGLSTTGESLQARKALASGLSDHLDFQGAPRLHQPERPAAAAPLRRAA